MSEQHDSESDSAPPTDMFSIVWVKMEVDEEGTVDGIDTMDDQQSDAQEPQDLKCEPKGTSVQNTERLPRRTRKQQPRKLNLKCDHCDYKTSYNNALKFHVLKHTNPEPLSCEHCDYTTRYPCSLRRHRLGQHMLTDSDSAVELPKFNCSECEYTTKFRGNLAAHKRKHATEKMFKCNQCSFSTAYKHSFKKHSKVHTIKENNTLYQCDRCTFATQYEGHITRHLAQIHKIISTKAHKCDQCQFSTTVKWRLNVHKNRSHQNAPIKCESCDFVTEYMCGFKMHKVKHSGKINRVEETDIYIPNDVYVPLEYDELSERTDQRLNSKTGETSSVPNLPTISDRDNDTLVPAMIGKTTYLLDTETDIDWRTIEVKENPGQLKPFQCTRCNYTSRFKASVQRHFQRHHTGENSRPFKCMHCDFSTKTKDQISLHNKRSKSDTLLTCKLCDFTTNLKCQNVMHQKVHYPYKCKFCSYTCRSNGDIQRHYTTVHLGNGLKCQYCDYRAARKDSLTCHETIHTGLKPFQCKYCDYATIRRSVLDNHVRKNHPEHYTVTIIDYSKIQSLKIERSGFAKDIAENNPLYQGCLKRNEIENKSLDKSGPQLMQSNSEEGAFESKSTEGMSESKWKESMFESKLQEGDFERQSKPSELEVELGKHYNIETNIEVSSI